MPGMAMPIAGPAGESLDEADLTPLRVFKRPFGIGMPIIMPIQDSNIMKVSEFKQIELPINIL